MNLEQVCSWNSEQSWLLQYSYIIWPFLKLVIKKVKYSAQVVHYITEQYSCSHVSQVPYVPRACSHDNNWKGQWAMWCSKKSKQILRRAIFSNKSQNKLFVQFSQNSLKSQNRCFFFHYLVTQNALILHCCTIHICFSGHHLVLETVQINFKWTQNTHWYKSFQLDILDLDQDSASRCSH